MPCSMRQSINCSSCNRSRFRTRCPKAEQICADEEPELKLRGQGHPVACHFAELMPVAVAAPVAAPQEVEPQEAAS